MINQISFILKAFFSSLRTALKNPILVPSKDGKKRLTILINKLNDYLLVQYLQTSSILFESTDKIFSFNSLYYLTIRFHLQSIFLKSRSNLNLYESQYLQWKNPQFNKNILYPQAFEKQHQEIHSIFFKHDKINGRQACSTCNKTYSQSQDSKYHIQKMHQTDFQVQDFEANVIIHAKRKSKFIKSEKEQRDILKRQNLFEDMNKPATQAELIIFRMKLIEIPSLGIIDQNYLIDNYLSVATPHEPKVHSINNFAYKVYHKKYIVEKRTRALDFANEYAILKKSKQRKILNLLYLDGTIFNSYYVALRLPYYKTTLRDYVRAVKKSQRAARYSIMINQRSQRITSNGIYQLRLEAGYDFNRAVRNQDATLGTALGTPGYFPIREKWLKGSIQCYIWSLAAIIFECDLEKMSSLKQKVKNMRNVKQDDN